MLFRYPSAAATHLVDCCIVRLRTMSSGEALSSPHDCLESIKTNLTAAHAAIGSTRAMASPASGDSPLGDFLTPLKHPLPSRYRAHQGPGADPHGEPDRFSRYCSYSTIYTSIVSYESRRVRHKI